MVFRSNSVARISFDAPCEYTIGKICNYFDASPPVSFRVAAGLGLVSSPTVVAVL